MRSILIFSLILFSSLGVKSQDVHLTQYYTSNTSLNPAYTGNYYGDIRAVVNYRSQWAQVDRAFKTSMFSVEKKINRFPDEIGVGLLVVNDQVSAYNLHTNKVLLSISYQKDINKHFIRFGIQGGMVFRSINLSNQTFPDQWNYPIGVFDASVPNGETHLQNATTYPDMNVGAGWARRFGKTKLSAGYALSHVNRPKDGFVSNDLSLPFRHTFNTSAAYSLTPQFSIVPHLLFMTTAKATDLMIGSNFHKMFRQDLGVMIGTGYRRSTMNSDAALAIAGLTYKRLELGFSFDFNVSQLSKEAKSKSAWEIMLTYTTPSRIPAKVTLPCDRY